jgi:hypothetical protein
VSSGHSQAFQEYGRHAFFIAEIGPVKEHSANFAEIIESMIQTIGDAVDNILKKCKDHMLSECQLSSMDYSSNSDYSLFRAIHNCI